jgi:hypothetical protein
MKIGTYYIITVMMSLAPIFIGCQQSNFLDCSDELPLLFRNVYFGDGGSSFEHLFSH